MSCVQFLSYVSIQTVHNIFRDSYNLLLENLGEIVQKTGVDFRKMIQHISTKFVGQIPGADPSDIPLNPKRADYKDVVYWARKPWMSIRNRTTVKTMDAPVLKLFLEDEFGNPMPEDIKDEVLKDTRGFWKDELTAGRGEMLTCYSDLGFKMRNDFRVLLEGKYPWLRLCDGHWKVYQLWINYFSSWKDTNMPSSAIVISSDEGEGEDGKGSSADGKRSQENNEDGPTGAKRGRENDNEGADPSKRHKGKGKAAVTPDFHPPKPKRGKVKANVAKVSKCPFWLARCLLTTSRRIHCICF